MRLAAFLAAWLLAAPAEATELRYEAASGCPSHDDVQRRLAVRAPRAERARIAIRRESRDRFVGDLAMGEPDALVERRLEGRSCAAVVDAMILVAALHTGPPASPAPEPVEPPVPPSPGPDPRPAAASDPAPGRPIDAPAPRPVDRSGIEIAFGVAAITRRLAVWDVYGGAVFGELAAPAWLARWHRPSARVGLHHVRTTSSPTFADGAAAVTSTGATAELCPLGAAPLSTPRVDLVLALCGVLDVASAGGVRSRLWVDGGPVARLSAQVGPKDAVRGFGGVSGGVLGRVGQPLAAGSAEPSPAATAVVSVDAPWNAMVSLEGGVLFP